MAKLTTAERFRRELKSLARESRAWEPIWKRAEFGVQFLIDGRHYSDAIENSVNSDDIRWIGEEGFNRLRHEAGSATIPGTLTARPVDTYGSDPDMQDFVARLMIGETELPEREWEDAWYDTAMCSSAAAYGVLWIDYLPDEGPNGTLLGSADDPRTFMMDRRVKSTFDPRCRFVYRKMRMTIGEVKRRCEGKGGWDKRVAAKLIPDDGECRDLFNSIGAGAEETTSWVKLGANRATEANESDDDKEVTVFVKWARHSEDTEDARDYTEYEPSDRYMRCTSCAYRTETQGVLPPNDDGTEQSLPDELQNGCPECMQSPDVTKHGNMVRIDGEEAVSQTIAYPDGYLCIMAPYALPGVEEFLYEGEWPAKLRSYPVAFLPRFRHPFKVCGPSLADLCAWNQTAMDMMMRLVLERMVASEPAPVMPLDAFVDARGQPWERSTERNNGAFYYGDHMPMTGMIGGDPGIPAVWSQVISIGRQSLTGSEGIADFGLAEGQSRDIPAQSVALQVRQEEIPLADFKRRYNRQRGLLTDVLYDWMRAVYPAEVLAQIAGTDEADQVRAVAISDLPNMSFRYDTSPAMEPQDAVASAATDKLIATIEARPWAVNLVAHQNKIAPALVRKAQNDFQAWQAQQMAAQSQAAAAQAAAGATAGGSAPASPGASPQSGEQPSAMVERLLGSIGSR